MAKRLHLHYDVDPELMPRGDTREVAGLVVRLWGVHEKGARALPGCRKSREIAARLAEIGGWALDGEDCACAELEPVRLALYDSCTVHGADEIALPIRIRERTPRRTRGATPAEERCLAHIRARLRALGGAES